MVSNVAKVLIVLAILILIGLLVWGIYELVKHEDSKCYSDSDCSSSKICYSGNCQSRSSVPSGNGKPQLVSINGTATLLPGQSLNNNGYTLTMGSDGIATYTDNNGNTVWSSTTPPSGSVTPYQLQLNTDGTLCVYDSSTPSVQSWCSPPSTSSTAPYYAYINNGATPDFCVVDSTNTSLWCAAPASTGPGSNVPGTSGGGGNGTTYLSTSGAYILLSGDQLVSQDGSHSLVMQSDGNVVIYNGDNTNPDNAIWESNTDVNDNTAVGNSPYIFALGPDGNLCMYSGTTSINSSNAHWCSNTSGAGAGSPYTATLGNDGNLTLTDSTSTAIWDSNNDAPAPGQYWSPPS
jgi:hypothetical protein